MQGILRNQPRINLRHMQTRQAAIASLDAPATFSNYKQYVNPQWVALLNLLEMNVEYERCLGTELFVKGGRRILDFVSGYCVHNVGHNHPHIIEALKDEMDKCGPAMLQSHVPEIAGELARRLCNAAGGGLEKVYFGSSGSEGVEAAIKFARATTGRNGIVYAKSSFHGLTAGALSLMNDEFWRERFGPLLADTHGVPYGDITALEDALAGKEQAAFVVEPLQAEGGIHVPSHEYLKEAEEHFWLRTNLAFGRIWWYWRRHSAVV
jgi:ornithine--oxo-acid transaminase